MAATARRAQIVAAATEVIAEAGYRQASFARIAKHAGLSSTRLISYHFADKGELIREVAGTVFESIGRFMHERMAGHESARELLEAYIRGVVGFTATHRAQMAALTQIFLNGGLDFDADDGAAASSHVEEILRHGQRTGEFRDFDPRVVGTSVQRSVEGLPFLLAADPDVDTGAYADELVTLFDLATRAAS